MAASQGLRRAAAAATTASLDALQAVAIFNTSNRGGKVSNTLEVAIRRFYTSTNRARHSMLFNAIDWLAMGFQFTANKTPKLCGLHPVVVSAVFSDDSSFAPARYANASHKIPHAAAVASAALVQPINADSIASTVSALNSKRALSPATVHSCMVVARDLFTAIAFRHPPRDVSYKAVVTDALLDLLAAILFKAVADARAVSSKTNAFAVHSALVNVADFLNVSISLATEARLGHFSHQSRLHRARQPISTLCALASASVVPQLVGDGFKYFKIG